ncbi:MAG: hypothetical protein DRO04_01815 [Candidatus Iainarchaeum archaeon]|uniref:Uncharacterized protein n=1 Tax=Candidatus Iainarchaeum sp. TaxID=3101447 RepID=A0A497JI33_9ARCH|nr:MAG: hypothetical protein DRO04_01815 [Candidatus Diapherotrites archaeon]
MVDYATYQTFLGLRGSTYGNKILLDAENKFYGCGYYNVEITGSVPVWYGKLLTEQMIVFVKVGKRQITEECRTDKIQNIMNFIPVDRGLSVESPHATWLATVNTGVSELEEKLATLFAKKLLKDEHRVSRFRGGNTIKVGLGNVKYGMLMELRFENIAENEPVSIKATVNEALKSGGMKAENITKEAAYALRSLMDQTLSNGCISKNFSYMLLSTPKKKLEVFKFVPKKFKKFKVYMDRENCQKFRVISNLKQAVRLYVNERDKKWLLKNGIAEIKIKFKGKEIQPQQEIMFTEEDYEPKSEAYVKEFELCIKGDEKVYKAHEQKLKISASGLKLVKDKDMEVYLQACVINPYTAFVKAFGRGKGEYYAALHWSGDKETVKVEDVIKAVADEAGLSGKIMNLRKKEDGEAVTERVVLGREAAEKQARTKYLGGVAAYALACSAASYTCGIFTFGAGFLNMVLDCWLPAFWLASKAFETTKQATDWIESQLGAVFGWVWKKIKNAVGYYTAKGGEALNKTERYLRANTGESTKRIATAAAMGISTRAIVKEVAGRLIRGGRHLSPMLAKSLSSELAEKLSEAMVKEGLGEKAVKAKAAAALRNKLQETLQERLYKAIAGEGKKGIIFKRAPIIGKVVTTEMLEKAVEESLESTTKEMPSMLASVSKNLGDDFLKLGAVSENLDELAKKAFRKEVNDIAEAVAKKLPKRAKAEEVLKALNTELSKRGYPTASLHDLGVTAPDAKINVKMHTEQALVNKADDITSTLKEGLKKQVSTFEEIGKRAAQNVEGTADEIVESTTKSVGKRLGRIRSAAWSLAKGLFCGAAASAAGYGGWCGYWALAGTKLEEVYNINVDEPAQLERGAAYKITIKPVGKNNYDIAIKKVKPEEIPKDAEWIEDCIGESIKLDALGRKLEEKSKKKAEK